MNWTFLFLLSIVFQLQPFPNERTSCIDENPTSLLPQGDKNEMYHKTYYDLEFSENDKQAYWVAYNLTCGQTIGRYERESSFSYDATIKNGSAKSAQYLKTGFDRGHLVPARDMAFDAIAMEESFLMSNISPQKPGFNRGIWKKLEDLVRGWACDYKQIFIVCGPILKTEKKLNKLPQSNISITNYFFKIIFDSNQKKPKMIGFLMKNEASGSPLSCYAVSVDSIEVKSGIDFFPMLPDSLETKLEKQCNTNDWKYLN